MAELPRTAAGRALLDALPLNEWHPVNREIVVEHILAIEAEAATPPYDRNAMTPAEEYAEAATPPDTRLREALETIIEAWDKRDTAPAIEQVKALIPTIIAARALLQEGDTDWMAEAQNEEPQP